jgi:hypothetical protein
MTLKEIKFVVDEAVERESVLIDLKQHGEVWEDFYDAAIARQRRNEPRKTLADLKKRLGLPRG